MELTGACSSFSLEGDADTSSNFQTTTPSYFSTSTKINSKELVQKYEDALRTNEFYKKQIEFLSQQINIMVTVAPNQETTNNQKLTDEKSNAMTIIRSSVMTSEQQESYDRLTSMLEKLKLEMTQTKNNESELRLRMSKIEDLLNEKDQFIRSLKIEKEKLMQSQKNFETKIDLQEGNERKLKEELSSLQYLYSKLQEKESKKRNSDLVAKQLKKNLSQLQVEKGNCSKQNKKLMSEIHSFKLKEEKNKKIQTTIQAKNKSIENLQRKTKTLLEEIVTLKQEKEKAKLESNQLITKMTVEVENLRKVVKNLQENQPDMMTVEGLQTKLTKEQETSRRLKETIRTQVKLSESQQLQIASELEKNMKLQLALKNSNADYEKLRREFNWRVKNIQLASEKDEKIEEEFQNVVSMASEKQDVIIKLQSKVVDAKNYAASMEQRLNMREENEIQQKFNMERFSEKNEELLKTIQELTKENNKLKEKQNKNETHQINLRKSERNKLQEALSKVQISEGIIRKLESERINLNKEIEFLHKKLKGEKRKCYEELEALKVEHISSTKELENRLQKTTVDLDRLANEIIHVRKSSSQNDDLKLIQERRKLEELSSSYELLQIEFANQAESAGETEERLLLENIKMEKENYKLRQTIENLEEKHQREINEHRLQWINQFDREKKKIQEKTAESLWREENKNHVVEKKVVPINVIPLVAKTQDDKRDEEVIRLRMEINQMENENKTKQQTIEELKRKMEKMKQKYQEEINCIRKNLSDEMDKNNNMTWFKTTVVEKRFRNGQVDQQYQVEEEVFPENRNNSKTSPSELKNFDWSGRKKNNACNGNEEVNKQKKNFEEEVMEEQAREKEFGFHQYLGKNKFVSQHSSSEEHESQASSSENNRTIKLKKSIASFEHQQVVTKMKNSIKKLEMDLQRVEEELRKENIAFKLKCQEVEKLKKKENKQSESALQENNKQTETSELKIRSKKQLESLYQSQEELNEAQNKLIKTQEELNLIRDELKQTQEKQTLTQEELKQTQNELERTQKKQNLTHKELKQIQEELERTQKEQNLSQEDLKQTQNELERTQKEQNLTQEELKQTQGELERTQKKQNLTHKELKQIQEELERTQKEQNLSQEDLKQTQNELERTQKKQNLTEEKLEKTREGLNKTHEELYLTQENLEKIQEELYVSKEDLQKEKSHRCEGKDGKEKEQASVVEEEIVENVAQQDEEAFKPQYENKVIKESAVHEETFQPHEVVTPGDQNENKKLLNFKLKALEVENKSLVNKINDSEKKTYELESENKHLGIQNEELKKTKQNSSLKTSNSYIGSDTTTSSLLIKNKREMARLENELRETTRELRLITETLEKERIEFCSKQQEVERLLSKVDQMHLSIVILEKEKETLIEKHQQEINELRLRYKHTSTSVIVNSSSEKTIGGKATSKIVQNNDDLFLLEKELLAKSDVLDEVLSRSHVGYESAQDEAVRLMVENSKKEKEIKKLRHSVEKLQTKLKTLKKHQQKDNPQINKDSNSCTSNTEAEDVPNSSTSSEVVKMISEIDKLTTELESSEEKSKKEKEASKLKCKKSTVFKLRSKDD